MSIRRLVLIGLAAAVLSASARPETQTSSGQTAPSLYKRLGGYDALAAVVDDFVPRLVTDPQLGRFFAGHSADSQKRLRQLALDLVCSATGGPCVYIGRPLKTAHAGLGISESDWQMMLKHFEETLDKVKVGGKERQDLVALVGSLKADIVEKP